jgi:membrane-associated phospholipid phosphatase
MPAFGGALHDATVQRWELALFNASPAAVLAGRFPSMLLSEVLHAGYLSYYPLIYLPPLIAWLRHEERAFDDAVSAVILTFLVCCTVFVVWPVAGPRFMWPAPANIPDGPIRSLTLALLQAGSSRGAAFPSSHVAVAVAQTAVASRRQPRVGVVCAASTVLLAAGAIYGGFHYAVDVATGAILGAAVGGVVAYRGDFEDQSSR